MTAPPLLFPKIYHFDQIFARWEPYRSWSTDHEAPEFSEEFRCRSQDRRDRGMRIGTFCAAQVGQRRYYLRVWPRAQVVEAIKMRTIHIDNDYVNFEIIQGSRVGVALVCAHQGRISGGPWLANINLDTIPRPREEDQP